MCAAASAPLLLAPAPPTEMACAVAELAAVVQALGPEEALGNLKIGELKDYCKKFGLKPAGAKLDLIKMLAAYLKAFEQPKGNPSKGKKRVQGKQFEKEPPRKALAVVSPMRKSGKQGIEEAANVAETVSAPVDFTVMTITQLRAKCKDLDLKPSGKKAELVERLQQHDQQATSAAAFVAEKDALEDADVDMANMTVLQTGAKCKDLGLKHYVTNAEPAGSSNVDVEEAANTATLPDTTTEPLGVKAKEPEGARLEQGEDAEMDESAEPLAAPSTEAREAASVESAEREKDAEDDGSEQNLEDEGARQEEAEDAEMDEGAEPLTAPAMEAAAVAARGGAGCEDREEDAETEADTQVEPQCAAPQSLEVATTEASVAEGVEEEVAPCLGWEEGQREDREAAEGARSP